MRVAAAFALLLVLVAVGAGLGDSLSRCSESDVTALRDTLRQSACRLVPGQGNMTETEAFQEYVFTKHGERSSKLDFYNFFTFFTRSSPQQTLSRTGPLPTCSSPVRI